MHPALEKKLVPLGGGVFQEKRFFSDSVIQGHVEEALRDVQGDGAVLDVRLDNERVAAVMAARLSDQWSMGLVVERKHTGDWAGGARVTFDW